jgi:hypothetical protein
MTSSTNCCRGRGPHTFSNAFLSVSMNCLGYWGWGGGSFPS